MTYLQHIFNTRGNYKRIGMEANSSVPVHGYIYNRVDIYTYEPSHEKTNIMVSA